MSNTTESRSYNKAVLGETMELPFDFNETDYIIFGKVSKVPSSNRA